jgi:ribosomal protein S18 acetylase RimI-like enzyme
VSAAPARIEVVTGDQWPVVAWLWQCFRHDLAMVVNGLPYADGRYQARSLDQHPSPNGAGYLAWRPHPNTGEDAPVGFAVVDGLRDGPRSMTGFWVAPAARRDGIGRALALDVIGRHTSPWRIGFQHDNHGAIAFWRSVADTAFGERRWTEIRQPVPGRPHAPADHIIESR